MATKDQKNIKVYVNLTKSMLYEAEGQVGEVDAAAKAAAAAEEEKLRKSTAENILRYLNNAESQSEQDIKKVIRIAKDASKFEVFYRELSQILGLADTKVQKFGARVLNYPKLSLSGEIPKIEKKLKSLMAIEPEGPATGLEERINPNALIRNPRDSRSKKSKFNIDDLKSQDAGALSNAAKRAKDVHLKNIRTLSEKLKSSEIDPLKVFSFPANADIFTEMRTIYTILTILEDFGRVGKNLEGEAEEQLEYLNIITPQRMTEIYKTSRGEFNKIITTFIRGVYAKAAESDDRVAQAKKKPETFSMAATGKLSEVFDLYESTLVKIEIDSKEDWYDKLRDKTHEHRITFDDWARCLNINKKQKLEIFGFLLSTPPKKVESILDKMEIQMTKTKGRCRPDPESQIPFMENKNILKEELTIHNETENDMSEFMNAASEFYPYSKQNLGFDKPVSLRLVSDLDNSQNTFGKTAHYDPNSMEIVVYTDNRHPKDMLRSLSHELVHHAQNCRGDFDGDHETGEGYAQNDPYMREKEAEAYLVGNGFMVRDYEDSLKEKNKMLSEKKIREMVRAGLKKALFEQEKMQEGDKPDFLDIDKDGDKEESMKDASDSIEEACGDDSIDLEEESLQEMGRHDPDSGYDELKQQQDDDELDGEDDSEDEIEEASTKDTPDRVTGRDSARRLRPLEEKSALTIESRLQDKNNFLFEKLTKMWTK